QLIQAILGASPIFSTTSLKHSRLRYSSRLQLIQADTRGEPDIRFRLNDRTYQTTLSRHSRSRYSRRLQLIQTSTRGEPDLSNNIIKALETQCLNFSFIHNTQIQLQILSSLSASTQLPAKYFHFIFLASAYNFNYIRLLKLKSY
ncbi:hypothetical protein GIB67_022025, partial [Kingdonia uniflora]